MSRKPPLTLCLESDRASIEQAIRRWKNYLVIDVLCNSGEPSIDNVTDKSLMEARKFLQARLQFFVDTWTVEKISKVMYASWRLYKKTVTDKDDLAEELCFMLSTGLINVDNDTDELEGILNIRNMVYYRGVKISMIQALFINRFYEKVNHVNLYDYHDDMVMWILFVDILYTSWKIEGTL